MLLFYFYLKDTSFPELKWTENIYTFKLERVGEKKEKKKEKRKKKGEIINKEGERR